MPQDTPRRRRVGRPHTPAKDSDGHDVKGLARSEIKDKSGKVVGCRFYAAGSKPRLEFGSDRDKAIAALRRWQSDRRKTLIELEVPTEWSEEDLATIQQALADPAYASVGEVMLNEITPVEKLDIPESVFWKKVAEVFATDEGRNKAAKLTGYKLIKRLKDTSAFPRVLSLLEVGRLHFGKRDDDGVLESGQAGYDTKEHRKAWLYWMEFCKAVGVSTVDDVTRDTLVNYRNVIAALNLEARTVFNRYNHVGAVINTSIDRRPQHKVPLTVLRESFLVIVRKGSMPFLVEIANGSVGLRHLFEAAFQVRLQRGSQAGQVLAPAYLA